MKNKTALNIAVISICFALMKFMPSPSVKIFGLIIVISACMGMFMANSADYSFKYGKALKSRKLRKNIERDLLKMNFITIMLLIYLCINYFYIVEYEILRFIGLLIGFVFIVTILTKADLDKGRIKLFNTNKPGIKQ